MSYLKRGSSCGKDKLLNIKKKKDGTYVIDGLTLDDLNYINSALIEFGWSIKNETSKRKSDKEKLAAACEFVDRATDELIEVICG